MREKKKPPTPNSPGWPSALPIIFNLRYLVKVGSNLFYGLTFAKLLLLLYYYFIAFILFGEGVISENNFRWITLVFVSYEPYLFGFIFITWVTKQSTSKFVKKWVILFFTDENRDGVCLFAALHFVCLQILLMLSLCFFFFFFLF